MDCQEVGVVFENRDRVVRLGRMVVFWGIFVFLLYGGSVVTAPKFNTAEAGMEGRDIPSAGVMAEPEDSLDVIVLGDSESHSAVSPMVLWKNHGITSFVCGQSGQRAVEAYYMLKKVLTMQKPKVVILETDLFYHSREWQREWNLAIERTARYYFPMVQYHNRWKGLTAGDWKGLPFEGRRDVNKGFLPSRDIRPYKGGPYMVKTEDREALRGTVTFWTDRLVELCRKEGIHLLLVGTPTPKNWDYRRHNGVSDYAAKKKLPFLDMNLLEKELNMDWDRDSRDEGDHLNTYGAEKVSRYLGDYLKANYGLTDHRKGEGAKRWWKDFESARRWKEVAIQKD